MDSKLLEVLPEKEKKRVKNDLTKAIEGLATRLIILRQKINSLREEHDKTKTSLIELVPMPGINQESDPTKPAFVRTDTVEVKIISVPRHALDPEDFVSFVRNCTNDPELQWKIVASVINSINWERAKTILQANFGVKEEELQQIVKEEPPSIRVEAQYFLEKGGKK